MKFKNKKLLLQCVLFSMFLAVPFVLNAAENEPPKNARETFRELGVGDRYFNRLIDDRSLTAGENETLWRILLRLRVFSWENLEGWALDGAKLEEAVQVPKEWRGSIFRLHGRVMEVEPITPPAEAASLLELAKYYRCRIELDASSRVVDVYTEFVPMEWQKGAKPDAVGGAMGVFLKIGAKSNDASPLVFAARRVAWYPDNVLGRLGMDYGLFGSVQDRKGVTAADREAFYQMLAAVGRVEPSELSREAQDALAEIQEDWQWTDDDGKPHYSVKPLFNDNPANQRGRLVEFKGTARRIEKIPVSDPDIVARFGIRSYYQVSLFTDDSEGYPLTFCIRDLPANMPYGNVVHYGETVRIAGFFFKTWSYAVPKVTEEAPSKTASKTHRQLSPLLIGRSLTWYRASGPVDNMPSAIFFGSLFALAMAVIWLLAWLNRRREASWLERMESPPSRGAALDVGLLAAMDHGGESENEETPTPVDPSP